jgi:hypothetical protein
MPRTALLFLSVLSVGACTGLVAGPESSQVTPVSASRDSAWTRARRAMQAETFTVDVTDSVAGHIVATRYAGSNAKLGSATACRLRVALDVRGSAEAAQVSTTSRWLAPQPMQEQAGEVCEKERTEVLARVAQTIEPPPAP